MKMELQGNVPEIFKSNITTFKETSKDDPEKGCEPKYMTQSEVEVINFDDVKKQYIHGMKLNSVPNSSDALFISRDGSYYLIEFKNGKISQKTQFNVYYKIYDSLLILNDIIKRNISFSRENIVFILVYNNEKNGMSYITDGFSKKGNIQRPAFGLEKFEKLYFKEIHTYTEDEFERNFLEKIV